MDDQRCVSRRPPIWRAALVITGGVLVHLTLGTLYTFGNLTPYMTSYIRVYSSPKDLRYEDSVWIFALAGMGLGASMTFGGFLEKKLGPRLATLLGGLLMSAGVALTYFTVKVSFAVTLLTYGLMFGLGIGIAYAIPLACGMKWLPERKGLVNGIVVGGFGGGAFIFDQVQTAFINPHDVSPKDKVGGDSYFTRSQVKKVPDVFLLLGGCYAAMQIIGSMLLAYPPTYLMTLHWNEFIQLVPMKGHKLWLERINEKKYQNLNIMQADLVNLLGKGLTNSKDQILQSRELQQQELTQKYEPVPKEDDSEPLIKPKPPLLSDGSHQLHDPMNGLQPTTEDTTYDDFTLRPKELFKSKPFYMLWFMFFLNLNAVSFISTLYKAYGQTFIKDDVFLAIVGSFAALFNFLGRVFWGVIADKFSFKVAMVWLCSLFTVLMLTFDLTYYGGKAMFFIWVCLLFGTFSGTFSLMPTACAKCFGLKHYSVNYGILFTALVAVSPISALITSQLKNVLGWNGMFFLTAGSTFLSLILAMFFNVKKNGKNI